MKSIVAILLLTQITFTQYTDGSVNTISSAEFENLLRRSSNDANFSIAQRQGDLNQNYQIRDNQLLDNREFMLNAIRNRIANVPNSNIVEQGQDINAFYNSPQIVNAQNYQVVSGNDLIQNADLYDNLDYQQQNNVPQVFAGSLYPQNYNGEIRNLPPFAVNNNAGVTIPRNAQTLPFQLNLENQNLDLPSFPMNSQNPGILIPTQRNTPYQVNFDNGNFQGNFDNFVPLNETVLRNQDANSILNNMSLEDLKELYQNLNQRQNVQSGDISNFQVNNLDQFNQLPAQVRVPFNRDEINLDQFRGINANQLPIQFERPLSMNQLPDQLRGQNFVFNKKAFFKYRDIIQGQESRIQDPRNEVMRRVYGLPKESELRVVKEEDSPYREYEKYN